MLTPNTPIVTHSPGPWRVTDEISRVTGGEVIRPNCDDAVDSPVAFVCDFNRYDRDEERQANARLIAAAPDLLKALRGILWAVDADVTAFYPRLAAECGEARTLITSVESRVR